MQANKSYFGQKYPNFIQTWPTENVSTYCMISRNPAIFQYTHPFIPHSGESQNWVEKSPGGPTCRQANIKKVPFFDFLRGRKRKDLICSHQHWTPPPRLKVVLVPRYQNGRPLKSVRLKHKALPEAQRIHNSSNLVTCTKCKFGHMVEPFALFANLVAPLVLSHCLGLPYWYQLALS